MRCIRYWWREFLAGYRSLVNFERGLPPEPLPVSSETEDWDDPGDANDDLAGADDFIPVAADGQTAAEIPDPASAGLWEQPASISDLQSLLNFKRQSGQAAARAAAVPFNDPDREAARQERINANLEEMARRELAMQQYILANAERANKRKAEIEAEIRALALQLTELEKEREAAKAQNLGDERLQELAAKAREIFNRIDVVEEERKFIRHAVNEKKAPNQAIIDEMVNRRRAAIQTAARNSRDAQRAQQIRDERDQRIRQRAERLARTMSHRSAEIAAQKENTRISRMRRQP